ncbi:MAG: hypothetical protein R3C59_15795 [Planctomycetaceae bacterium]
MAKTNDTPHSQRNRNRRYFLYSLGILLCIEASAWICDGLFGFRRQLLGRLNQLQIVNQPIEAQSRRSLQLPPGTLSVRSREPVPVPNQPYILGGREVPDARPSDAETVVTANDNSTSTLDRVFILGGSAAFGYPYSYEQTFSGLLEEPMRQRGLRVINASRVGVTSGEVVPTAGRIVDDFAPQALILFIGNNEWIHWMPEQQPRLRKESLRLLRSLSQSRTISAVNLGLLSLLHRGGREAAPRGVFASHQEIEGCAYALAHPSNEVSFDPPAWLDVKQRFLETFESNMTEMVRYAKQAHVRVFVCTVPFNYKLSPAWKHPQPEAFALEHLAAVRHNIRSATRLIEKSRFADALTLIDETLRLEPLPPVLHYLKGQCLEAMGIPARAETAYALCREHMVGNLGGRHSINERIARVAEVTNAELIDLRSVFDDFEHRQGRYFNVDLIHDDCHPTPLGHQVIAAEILKHF